jgi:hypothetical protein
MAKRSTKLIGIKGIRKMLEWVKIALTLDDRKMGFRNAPGDDLRMVGRRLNLPSMTRQDGSGEMLNMKRFLELADMEVVTIGLKEGRRLRGYRIMGRVLEEAIQEIVMWVVEGFVYNEGRVMGMEDIWGTSLGTSKQERVKAMDEWEKNMMKFNRKDMTKKAMKEWMGRRNRGILPKVEVCRAPGVGGVFWYYDQEERDDEDDEESDCLEKNAAAYSLIGSIALSGAAPMKLTKNEIKMIEKEGRKEDSTGVISADCRGNIRNWNKQREQHVEIRIDQQRKVGGRRL